MKANDTMILGMIQNAEKEIHQHEKPLRDAMAKASEAIDLYEKALKGEREELAYGELNCDDAMNKGCITIDDPYGRPYAHIEMRKLGEKMLPEILAALEARRLAEEKNGIALGERGHSVKEWCEDAAKVWKHYYAPVSELKQDADKARIEALDVLDKFQKLREQRSQLISLLSEEAVAEINTAMKLRALQEENPVIAAGVDAVIVPLEDYELPDDIAELYLKVVGIPQAPCCDCVYDEYDEYDECDECDDDCDY